MNKIIYAVTESGEQLFGTEAELSNELDNSTAWASADSVEELIKYLATRYITFNDNQQAGYETEEADVSWYMKAARKLAASMGCEICITLKEYDNE